MVRILVVSDTHGRVGPLRFLAGRVGPVDYLLHAGDYYPDRTAVGNLFGLSPERCLGVVGNGDFPEEEPEEVIWEQEGVRIWMVHGHRHGVKRGLLNLLYRAQEKQCRVVVFGHSHQPLAVEDGGILFFNPGSPVLPRGTPVGTVGLLEIENGRVQSRHLPLNSF